MSLSPETLADGNGHRQNAELALAGPINITGTPLYDVSPGTGTGVAPPPIGSTPPPPAPEGDILKAQTLGWESPWLRIFGWPPYHPDPFVNIKGWDSIDAMLQNATYSAAQRVKKYATMYKGLSLRPAVDDPESPDYERAQRVCDFCSWALDEIRNPETGDRQDMRDVLWAIMDAFHHGFSVQEKVYRVVPKAETGLDDADLPDPCLGFVCFAPRRPQQIGWRLDPHTLRPINLTSRVWSQGRVQEISLKRVVRYTYQPQWGLPYGQGDARACWKHVGAIQELTRWWGLAMEYNGIPRVKMSTTNPDRAYQTQLRQLVEAWRQGVPMVIPPDVIIEILEAMSGSLDSFRTPLKYHEEQIWTSVLGQTLTTMQGTGAGSYAQASVHENTREYFFRYCREDIERVVREQILAPLVVANYGKERESLTPKATLGEWDNDERLLLAQFYDLLIKDRVVSPQEPFIRSDLGILPGSPTVMAALAEEPTQPTQPAQEKTPQESPAAA